MLYSSAAMPTKSITLRLPEQMAAELAAIARTKDVPISEVIREAVEDHITSLSTDSDFRQRLKMRLEEDQKILKRLAK
jgi:predicted DNA-binding protein